MENNPQTEGAAPEPQKKSPLDKIKKLSGSLKPLAEKSKVFTDKAKPYTNQIMAIVARLTDPLVNRLPAPARNLIQKHRGKILVGFIIIIFLLMMRSCLSGLVPKASLDQVMSQQGPAEDAPIPVKGFKVGRFNYEDSLNALGTIKGALEFKLSFEVPGVISSINYREGERYEEGALLISLRQDDILLRLKRAQAALNKAETEVKMAEDKVDEHEKLLSMGAIPKTTLDKVILELDKAKYDAEAARLEAKAHEAMLEKSNLYAPSTGMIGELNIEEGETITPNTLLGSHIMTEYVFAEFGVVERDVNKIALGQKARVFVDAYPDKTFEGVIENVAPVVTGTSRTATARVRIENPEQLMLPGMFTRIRILLYSKKNTLVVPTDAVQGSEGDQWVYMIDSEKNIVAKRPLTIGYKRPDYSQVDAGISEGELVAISGLERLEDGKKIRLLEIQEAEL